MTSRIPLATRNPNSKTNVQLTKTHSQTNNLGRRALKSLTNISIIPKTTKNFFNNNNNGQKTHQAITLSNSVKRPSQKSSSHNNLQKASRQKLDDEMEIYQDDENTENLDPEIVVKDKNDMSICESQVSLSAPSSAILPNSPITVPYLYEDQLTNRDLELLETIYFYNLGREKVQQPINYIKRQKNLSTDMRTILVDWLLEVTVSYNENSFSAEVIQLCVEYIDRFLSKMSVPKDKFQLVGVTCLMLASKMVDTIPPDAQQMADLTDASYRIDQIKAMERNILQTLDFDLYGSISPFFVNYYLLLSKARYDIDETAKGFEFISKRTYSGMFIEIMTEMVLMDYNLSINFRRSETAFCLVLIWRMVLDNLERRGERYVKDKMCRYVELRRELHEKDPEIIQDIKENSIISPDLMQIAESMKPQKIHDIINGTLNLWRSFLAQKRVKSLHNKTELLTKWFPYISDIYYCCLPENQDVVDVVQRFRGELMKFV